MLEQDNGQILGYVWQQVVFSLAEEWTNYIVCMQEQKQDE